MQENIDQDIEIEEESEETQVDVAGEDTALDDEPTTIKTDQAASKSADKVEKYSGLNSVVTRNIFYRDGYRNLMRVCLILAGAILGLIIALSVTISQSRPQDRFFATTSDGRLVQMVPLARPNMNDAAVVSWAARAASDIMTFGFHDYQRRLQESSQYFTRSGWQSFSQAIESAGLLDAIKERRQVVTAAPKRAPIIIQQGPAGGLYRWVVELPLIVTYQSGSAQDSQSLTIRLVIVRTSTLDSPSGVGIQQWIGR